MRARLDDSLVEDVREVAKREMTIDPEEVPLHHSIRAVVDYAEQKQDEEMREAIRG